MSWLKRTWSSQILVMVLVAVATFALGSTSVMFAAGAPIQVFRLADRSVDTQLAAVDTNGNMAVAVSNFPSTQNVAVSNFPSTQNVAVSNFPSTQNVAVSNFPVTELVLGSQTQVGYLQTAWFPSPNGVDVSKYERIRVYVHNFCGTGADGDIRVAVQADRDFGLQAFTLEVIDIPACGTTITRTYEVVGGKFRMQIAGLTPGANPTFAVQVFGR